MVPNPELPGPVMWQRLDLPGHDAAGITRMEGGALVTGMAVFLEGAPTGLEYTVRCDAAWRTLSGRVRGRRGGEPVDLRFERDAEGEWTLDGVRCAEVAGCEDLDLSFTPATNILPLRRLALEVGQSAEVRSAWLEWPEVRLSLLVQRYERRTPTEYDYASDLPGGDQFRGVLRVQPGGWVLDYAELWRAR